LFHSGTHEHEEASVLVLLDIGDRSFHADDAPAPQRRPAAPPCRDALPLPAASAAQAVPPRPVPPPFVATPGGRMD
jgi:hypothetical protein